MNFPDLFHIGSIFNFVLVIFGLPQHPCNTLSSQNSLIIFFLWVVPATRGEYYYKFICIGNCIMYNPGLWLLNYVTKVKQYERWYHIIYLRVGHENFYEFSFRLNFFESYGIYWQFGIDIQVLYGLRKKFLVQFAKLELCSFDMLWQKFL